MKTIENTALLAHKRDVDAVRRAAAIARVEAEREAAATAQRRANVAAMRKVCGQSEPRVRY